MRNEGIRMAQITANIHLWSKRLGDHMLVCPGCASSSRSPPFSIELQKQTSVYPSVEKKSKTQSTSSHLECERAFPFCVHLSHSRVASMLSDASSSFVLQSFFASLFQSVFLAGSSLKPGGQAFFFFCVSVLKVHSSEPISAFPRLSSIVRFLHHRCIRSSKSKLFGVPLSGLRLPHRECRSFFKWQAGMRYLKCN